MRRRPVPHCRNHQLLQRIQQAGLFLRCGPASRSRAANTIHPNTAPSAKFGQTTANRAARQTSCHRRYGNSATTCYLGLAGRHQPANPLVNKLRHCRKPRPDCRHIDHPNTISQRQTMPQLSCRNHSLRNSGRCDPFLPDSLILSQALRPDPGGPCRAARCQTCSDSPTIGA